MKIRQGEESPSRAQSELLLACKSRAPGCVGNMSRTLEFHNSSEMHIQEDVHFSEVALECGRTLQIIQSNLLGPSGIEPGTPTTW